MRSYRSAFIFELFLVLVLVAVVVACAGCVSVRITAGEPGRPGAGSAALLEAS